jgi:integrase/recombinase XerD
MKTEMISSSTSIVRATPTDLAERPDRNPELVYLSSLARGSRPTTASALRTIKAFCGIPGALAWHELRYQHTQALRTWLSERYAPGTANRHLAALRGVLREALRLELIADADHRRACDLQRVRGSRMLRGRALTAGEMKALFGVCDAATPFGARNVALLAVLYGAGLRRAEISALDLQDVDGAHVRVRLGKGNKERKVPLPAGSVRALDAWLRQRGNAAGPLFYRFAKGGRLTEHRLSDDGIATAVEALAELAGVKRCSPHDFRRTFVGDLLDNGADLPTVQRMAGHAAPTTTARYDRRGERAMSRAADLLSVPFA